MSGVSVVVPTRNAGPRFAALLAALRRQRGRGADLDLVVVDSGSQDETASLAERHGARVLAIDPARFDHGRSRDEGIAAAQGSFVVLLVQDAVPVDDGLVERLLEPFADPTVVGTFARQVARDEHGPLVARDVALHAEACADPLVGTPWAEGEFEAAAPSERLRRARFDDVCSALRRSAWADRPLGPCAFGEDLAWATAMLRSGRRIVHVPSAVVEHSHARTARALRSRARANSRLLAELFDLRSCPTIASLVRRAGVAAARDCAHLAEAAAAGVVGTGDALARLLQVPVEAAAEALGAWEGTRSARRDTL
jgi:GT2 family glycosyltransferase